MRHQYFQDCTSSSMQNAVVDGLIQVRMLAKVTLAVHWRVVVMVNQVLFPEDSVVLVKVTLVSEPMLSAIWIGLHKQLKTVDCQLNNLSIQNVIKCILDYSLIRIIYFRFAFNCSTNFFHTPWFSRSKKLLGIRKMVITIAFRLSARVITIALFH